MLPRLARQAAWARPHLLHVGLHGAVLQRRAPRERGRRAAQRAVHLRGPGPPCPASHIYILLTLTNARRRCTRRSQTGANMCHRQHRHTPDPLR